MIRQTSAGAASQVRVLVALALLAMLTGCGGDVPAPQPPTAPPAAGAPLPAPLDRTPAARTGPTPLVVFAAGSLIVPFDALEKAFEARRPEIDVRPEYHGSIQVIRHATELHESIDVVATADASLIPMLMTGVMDPTTGRAHADWFIRFASNRLALAYQKDSLYAGEINGENWPVVLARPAVKVGLPDPRFDAAGYRAFMAVVLAQERARDYTYFSSLFRNQFAQPLTLFIDDDLATVTVPEVLETRSGGHVVLRGGSIQLLALLESGDIDYAFEYESVIRQHGLGMVRLPDEVNLGSPEYEANYQRVQVNLDFRRFATVKPEFRGERIGYGITVPANASHPQAAAEFIAFLLGPEGRAIMEANHHPMFSEPLAVGYEGMPAILRSLCRSGGTP